LAFVIENGMWLKKNAFELLAQARLRGNRCLKLACENAEEAVKTPGFYGLDLSVVLTFWGGTPFIYLFLRRFGNNFTPVTVT
jgi:hypothetical protein